MHWTYVQRVSWDAKSLISNAYIYLSSFLYNYSYTVIEKIKLFYECCFMNVTVTAASVLVKLYVFLV